MDASTNIVGLFTNNVLGVPDYQRAYSWDAHDEVKTFWADLQDYVKSGSEQPYYLGHFLFEETAEKQYQVIGRAAAADDHHDSRLRALRPFGAVEGFDARGKTPIW